MSTVSNVAPLSPQSEHADDDALPAEPAIGEIKHGEEYYDVVFTGKHHDDQEEGLQYLNSTFLLGDSRPVLLCKTKLKRLVEELLSPRLAILEKELDHMLETMFETESKTMVQELVQEVMDDLGNDVARLGLAAVRLPVTLPPALLRYSWGAARLGWGAAWKLSAALLSYVHL